MAIQFLRFATISLGLLAAGTPVVADGGAISATDREVCARVIAPLERAYEIPGELMQAVALAESGRWDADRQEKYAWPWTVTAGGKGEFFADKAAAIARVRKLQAEGRRNIDVGCMQVNLMHHPRAFRDLDEAFDPAANAAYAAQYLDERWQATKSWMVAASQYHSSTPALARKYWQRVNVLWNEARRRANEALRLAQIEKFERERARLRRETEGVGVADRRTVQPVAFPGPPPPRLTTIRARPQFGGGLFRQPG